MPSLARALAALCLLLALCAVPLAHADLCTACGDHHASAPVPASAPAPAPTAVLATPGQQGGSPGGVFSSTVAPYSIVPPAHWTPTVSQDPNSGQLFDAFSASQSRLMIVVAFPAGVDPAQAVTAWRDSGHHVTVLGHLRLAGSRVPIYSYRDIAGDQPPVQQYAVVFDRTAAATWMLMLASPPPHFKADLPHFEGAAKTFSPSPAATKT